MPLVLAVFLLVPVAVAACWAGVFGGPVLQRRRADQFARRTGLVHPAPPDLVVRVLRRQRLVFAGIALGAVAAAVSGAEVGLALLYIGLAVGSLADQLVAPRPARGTPRVARPADSRLTDYVPGWVFAVAVAAAALVPVLAALCLGAAVPPGAGPGPASPVELLGGTALALGALGASLALARFLVRRPQPATSAADLDRADALRAQAVRDALHLTAAVSVCTAWQFAYVLTGLDVAGWVRDLGSLLWLGLLLGVAVVACTHELTGGPRHWRRRLVAA